MRYWEKIVVIWTLGYLIFLIAVQFLLKLSPHTELHQYLFGIGLAQNLFAMILTIRDLYKRPFPEPNQKLTWCLLITWTGGIGWLVYLCKYALKPRTSQADNGSPM